MDKEIEELAKLIKQKVCLMNAGDPSVGDCELCKQAHASCYDYAKRIYDAGYRKYVKETHD